MKKKFFTKASPKAVEGIRRAYKGTGAKVSAVLDPSTGLATVVVQIPTQEEDRLKRRVAA
jgi:hypothetical protein